jgi:hypothetical protein
MEWEGTITTDENYEGTGTLTTSPDPSDPLNPFKILLTSTANFGGYESEIEVLMNRDSFSKYSYFTDEEKLPSGTNIWWWNGDEVTGPVHTNGTFRIAGTPNFNGFVSSPNDWIGYTGDKDSNDPDERHGSDSPNFNEGANFNMNRSIDLPSSDQIDELSTLAAAGGITFDEDAEIEFFVDSGEGYLKHFEEETVNCGWGCSYTVVNETDYLLSDYNGIISVDGDVKVKGTIKGRVTLHSTDDIEIMGDVKYDTSPIDDGNSTDMAGFVSEGDVVVDRYAHDDTGSNDINIHASIMALGNSFKVENYSYGGSRGTINLLGGIIQKNRGAVGTFSGGSVASGYNKNYVYDTRLRNTVPPSFPRESIFSIVYWKDKPVEHPVSN